MPDGRFSEFIQIELEAIAEFKKSESIRQNRQVTDNEAAELWARTKARQFREDYESRQQNDE